MRAATGSQWRSMSSGVTCALFGCWCCSSLPGHERMLVCPSLVDKSGCWCVHLWMKGLVRLQAIDPGGDVTEASVHKRNKHPPNNHTLHLHLTLTQAWTFFSL